MMNRRQTSSQKHCRCSDACEHSTTTPLLGAAWRSQAKKSTTSCPADHHALAWGCTQARQGTTSRQPTQVTLLRMLWSVKTDFRW